jgi:hypothetical protein
MEDGEMDVEIPVKRDQTGALEFPKLHIEHAKVEGETINLDDEQDQQQYHIVYDRNGKIIMIKNPIPLIEKSTDQPYAASKAQRPKPIGTTQKPQIIGTPWRTSYESSLAKKGY